MAQEKVNLSKVNYDYLQFGRIIDNTFSQTFTPPLPPPPIITVNDFFNLYETLFYQIPQTGNINSHEYLIKKSTEYVGEQQTIDQTQALIAEITALRLENVESFKKEAELTSLKIENELLKTQISSLSTLVSSSKK